MMNCDPSANRRAIFEEAQASARARRAPMEARLAEQRYQQFLRTARPLLPMPAEHRERILAEALRQLDRADQVR